jgi:hypothetical protein
LDAYSDHRDFLPPVLAGFTRQHPTIALSKRTIIPTVRRCSECHESEAKHGQADHEFKLDEASPQWHGWYSLRRGGFNHTRRIDARRYGLEGFAEAQQPCGKDVPENTLSAMNQLEALFNKCSTGSTGRPN